MDVTSHSHVRSKREKLTIVKLVYQCIDCISLRDLTSPINKLCHTAAIMFCVGILTTLLLPLNSFVMNLRVHACKFIGNLEIFFPHLKIPHYLCVALRLINTCNSYRWCVVQLWAQEMLNAYLDVILSYHKSMLLAFWLVTHVDDLPTSTELLAGCSWMVFHLLPVLRAGLRTHVNLVPEIHYNNNNPVYVKSHVPSGTR